MDKSTLELMDMIVDRLKDLTVEIINLKIKVLQLQLKLRESEQL